MELPDDNEITHLSLEKLQQEYKRMKELKRRAEQQNVEARMSSQRVSPLAYDDDDNSTCNNKCDFIWQ